MIDSYYGSFGGLPSETHVGSNAASSYILEANLAYPYHTNLPNILNVLELSKPNDRGESKDRTIMGLRKDGLTPKTLGGTLITETISGLHTTTRAKNEKTAFTDPLIR